MAMLGIFRRREADDNGDRPLPGENNSNTNVRRGERLAAASNRFALAYDDAYAALEQMRQQVSGTEAERIELLDPAVSLHKDCVVLTIAVRGGLGARAEIWQCDDPAMRFDIEQLAKKFRRLVRENFY